MMMFWRKFRLSLGTASMLLGYFVIRYTTQQMYYADIPEDPQSFQYNSQPKSNQEGLVCDQVIHIASIQLEPESSQEFEFLLKTIFFHRHHSIHLHIIVNKQVMRKIAKNLLETWDLTNVFWAFTDLTDLKLPLPQSGTEAFLQKALPFILPDNTTEVIYLSNRVRFISDVYDLWRHFDEFSEHQTLGTLKTHKRFQVDKRTPDIADILLMKVAKIRRRGTSRYLKDVLARHRNDNSLQEFFKTVSDDRPYILPCSWGVSQDAVANGCHLNDPIKALIWSPQTAAFSANVNLESAKERALSELRSDALVYRSRTSPCLAVPQNQVVIDLNKPCVEYRYASAIKRRTHLYYVAGPETYQNEAARKLDVTLLTQFTLDRFGTFERFMASWEGPVHAVLYVTDIDAMELPSKIETSSVLQKRKNIAYHVVYKRGKFYPINYLRNVAMKEVQTSHLLFVDVDLVVNKGLYDMLKRYIKDYMLPRLNVTLVVPAFESLWPLTNLPRNKSELLTLMEQKKVIGYRMNRGWNLGHKPTNYPHWVKASAPYQAIWKDAYEPYVVIATKDAPLYLEILLERMGDKIAYGRELYARGYEFWVLPDVFIIHLPHPTSLGTNIWKTYRGYARCGAILFNEYRDVLKRQYPDKKF